MKNELEKLDAEIARDAALIRELIGKLFDKEIKRSDIFKKQIEQINKEVLESIAVCEKRIKKNAATNKR